jgi:hypothetical protein
MWADKAPGQGWTEGQPIPDGAGGKPDIFVASDGTATVVWFVGPPDSWVIKTARRPLGQPWSAVETISPAGSVRPNIAGDIAGNVTVSFTLEGAQRFIYAVDRPNSGPWGTATPIGAPGLADNVSDLVVAPNSGAATVFWQNGGTSAPLGARTRVPGVSWGMSPTSTVSGSSPGRLDLSELDRAAVDGMGLVTAAWLHRARCSPRIATRPPVPGSRPILPRRSTPPAPRPAR